MQSISQAILCDRLTIFSISSCVIPVQLHILPVTFGEEVCEYDTFQGRCPSDSVIDITRAWFGQQRLGSCISTDLGYLGCGKDAQGDLDSLCSGRQSCDVLIDQHSVPDLYNGNSCIKEINSYLDVEYTCMKGTSF